MEIVKCNKDDYATLAGIWKRSVKSSHDFLKEEHFEQIKAALTTLYFPNVELYAVVEQERFVGFIGLHGDMIEMLFIDSDLLGHGYGSALMDFAKHQGASKVDVNEQNPSALHFYKAKGFHVVARDERDNSGLPYPILHLSL